MHSDLTVPLLDSVRRAVANRKPLRIVGGNTKSFHGGECGAEDALEMAEHCGVVAYEPSELVITALSGTKLRDIEAVLAAHGQMLAFEPPYFGDEATLGGTLACGFSGPRRAFAGSARDFMLGCKIVNGRGELLSFGGQVMKNVAGFDVSRLMVGALGTLGVLLEISLRVLPKPEYQTTLIYAIADQQAAIEQMNRLAGQPWPLSGLAYDGGLLSVRLSGAEAVVASAAKRLGGEADELGDDFWLALREQRLAFFEEEGNLWRIAIAPAAATPAIQGKWLIDWGGALRWLKTDHSAEDIHEACAVAGARAEAFRGEPGGERIRLTPAMASVQRRIRSAFDPFGLLNPGRF